MEEIGISSYSADRVENVFQLVNYHHGLLWIHANFTNSYGKISNLLLYGRLKGVFDIIMGKSNEINGNKTGKSVYYTLLHVLFALISLFYLL